MTTVRPPAVAGTFYPAAAAELRTMTNGMLAEASDRARSTVESAGPCLDLPVGILVPHAGLVYSGGTAAAAWRLLASVGSAEATVVLLGTNHGAGWLDGVAAWDEGGWRTPAGEVEVDAGLAHAIVGLGPPFLVDREAHAREHSIEVQLPFLLAIAPGARIVPLSVATGTGPRALEAGRRLGGLLARERAAGRRIVLAISSDMAHYPAAAACQRVTSALLPAIRALDAAALARDEQAQRGSGVPGLACGMCGIEPAVLGLATLVAMGATAGTQLATSTSADAGGPPGRTVGYLAVRFDA